MEKLQHFDMSAQMDFAQEMMSLDTLRIEAEIMETADKLLEHYLQFQRTPSGGAHYPWVAQIPHAVAQMVSVHPSATMEYRTITVKLYPIFKADEARFMIEYQLRAQWPRQHIPVMD